MTEKQKNIISATVPVLREHGVALTTHFYKRMFSHHPELKNIFNMGNQQSGKQQKPLATAVLTYAEHIADPSDLLPELDRIGHKHASLDIRPEHYPIVGNHLLASIKEVLGEAASHEILEAWGNAYDQLAELMIGLEVDMYKNQTSKPGGWTGWRPFRVRKKEKESAEITSFYLYPADGGKVVPHIPGQFISIRMFLPDLSLNQARQYSLSHTPSDEHYRISVKREKGQCLNTNGMISNFLHDHVDLGGLVDLTAPIGNFKLNGDIEAPITFISGGVGLTPLMSNLYSLTEKNHSHPITWVHACRNQSVHAFRKQVNKITENLPKFEQHIFYDNLTDKDREEGIIEGPLDLKNLPSLAKHPNTKYYICGPAGFIQKQHQDLLAMGVDKKAVNFEEFGPQLLQLN